MLWTAKLRGYDEGNILAQRAKRHSLTIHYYPINFYEKKRAFYFIASGIVKGTPPHIEQCFRELKALRRPVNGRYVVKLEHRNEAFLSITAHRASAEFRNMVRHFYNPGLIHRKPAIIYPSGHEEWEVCAFDKRDLDRVLRIGERLYKLELISLRRTSMPGVQVMAAAPRLSKCQKEALELALKHGYYSYPRKIELSELARSNHNAASTFHAHLRKAENKVMPHVFGLCGGCGE
jgi:predicted DNA binding protein